MRISDNSKAENLGAPSPNTKQNTIKNTFIDLVERTIEQPEKHLHELSEFFNNLYHKKCLKSQIIPQKAGAFGALWDGASVIVNSMESDSEHRAKEGDLTLLKDSLNKLLILF